MVEPGQDCPFLRVNPPECDTSYAEALGAKYMVAQVLYDTLVFAVVCFNTYKSLQLFRKKRLLPLDMQNRIHIFASVGLASLIVRAFDPFGWRRFVPFTLILACYDLGGACLLSIGFDLAFEWIRGLRVTYGDLARKRSRSSPGFSLSSFFTLRHLCFFLQFLLFVSNMTFSFLTSLEVGPLYRMHLFKVVVQVTLSFVVVFALAFYGCQIYRAFVRHLNQHEKNQKSLSTASIGSAGGTPTSSAGYLTRTSTPGSNALSHMRIPLIVRSTGTLNPSALNALTSPTEPLATSPSSVASITATASPTPVPSSAFAMFNQSTMATIKFTRERASKVLKIVVFCIIALILTTALWAHVLYQEQVHKYTLEHPAKPPDSVKDLFIAAVFDIVQMVGFVATALYYSVPTATDESAVHKHANEDVPSRSPSQDEGLLVHSTSFGASLSPESNAYQRLSPSDAPWMGQHRLAYLNHMAANLPQQPRLSATGRGSGEAGATANDPGHGVRGAQANPYYEGVIPEHDALDHHELGSFYSEMRDPRDEALFMYAGIEHTDSNLGYTGNPYLDIGAAERAQMLEYQQRLEMQAQRQDNLQDQQDGVAPRDGAENPIPATNLPNLMPTTTQATQPYAIGMTHHVSSIPSEFDAATVFGEEGGRSVYRPESSIGQGVAVAVPVNSTHLDSGAVSTTQKVVPLPQPQQSQRPFFPGPSNFSLSSAVNDKLFTDYSLRHGRPRGGPLASPMLSPNSMGPLGSPK